MNFGIATLLGNLVIVFAIIGVVTVCRRIWPRLRPWLSRALEWMRSKPGRSTRTASDRERDAAIEGSVKTGAAISASVVQQLLHELRERELENRNLMVLAMNQNPSFFNFILEAHCGGKNIPAPLRAASDQPRTRVELPKPNDAQADRRVQRNGRNRLFALLPWHSSFKS
jgi:hypothetical protein